MLYNFGITFWPTYKNYCNYCSNLWKYGPKKTNAAIMSISSYATQPPFQHANQPSWPIMCLSAIWYVFMTFKPFSLFQPQLLLDLKQCKIILIIQFYNPFSYCFVHTVFFEIILAPPQAPARDWAEFSWTWICKFWKSLSNPYPWWIRISKPISNQCMTIFRDWNPC